MRYQDCTAADLEQAARETGLRVYHTGTATFRLKTSGQNPPYKRLSQRPPHRTVPGAVCWHGHRDFFRALFKRCPGAVIESTMAKYQGAQDFEEKYRATRQQAHDYMGFSIKPYDQACACRER